MNPDNVIEVIGLTVALNNSLVLNDFEFSLKKGSFHTLIGQNASGKSTLIKTLMGIISPIAGSIMVNGKDIQTVNTSISTLGMYAMWQDTKLFPNLTIAENAFFCDKSILYSKKKVHNRFEKLATELELDLDSTKLVSETSAVEKQFIELMRAYVQSPKILLLDEFCAFFTQHEIDKALRIIDRLHSQGTSILYITHDINEILTRSDAISILRDGKIISTFRPGELDNKTILELMSGKKLKDRYPKIPTKTSEAIINIHNLCFNNLKNISFTAYRGEILCITGLGGSGKSSIGRLLCGLDKPDSGYVFSFYSNRRITSHTVAFRSRIGYVSEENRKNLVPCFNSDKNLTLPSLDVLNPNFFIDLKHEEYIGNRYRTKLRYSIKNNRILTKHLSGGEQQKLSLSRNFLNDIDLLIIDEPTANVDIPSKTDVYNMLNFFVAKNKCVIILTSDFSEACGICDRVLVLNDGQIVKELTHDAADERVILSYALSKEQD